LRIVAEQSLAAGTAKPSEAADAMMDNGRSS